VRRLSVGVLNLDRADLTLDVLTRLAALNGDVWAVETIVVDNGSREEDAARLAAWCRAHDGRFASLLLVRALRNLGVGGGRNVCFHLYTGERLLFLDNDVVLPEDPRWLEALWETMDGDPALGLVAPVMVFADRPDVVQSAGIGLTERGRVGYLHRGDPLRTLARDLRPVVSAPAACWLLRRETQAQVGFFSEEYYPMHYQDVDYTMTILEAGWKIACDRRVTLRHIGNVTTRNLKDHSYARTAVRHAMVFREKWGHRLPALATLIDKDISWASPGKGDEPA
jgi:GT2 family glycosyltransferase